MSSSNWALSEPQERAAQRMYDARAANYDHSWHPAFAARVVELASLTPGERVLDLACGTGLASAAAAAAVGSGGAVVGVDVSKGMLAVARTRLRGAAPNVELFAHDIACLDTLPALRGRSFDAITCASALVLLDDADRERAVRQWVSLLRPGGRLLVDVPTPNNMPSGVILERTARRLGSKIPSCRDWVKDESSLCQLLERAGLTVAKIMPMQQTGESVRWLGVEDADGRFDDVMRGEHARSLWYEDLDSQEAQAARQRARELFREEWQKASKDGLVKSEDLVWLAIASKT